MKRISNNLFEEIQKVTLGVQEGQVDKAHYCATHVEHALYGKGECISEQHAEPDQNGNIEWYTVKFETGTHKINTENLKIVEGKSHSHGKKMKEETESVEEGNDGNLANNYPPYDKVTHGDVITGRLGKDHMGGKAKKKVKEEAEAVEEAKTATAPAKPAAKGKRSTGTAFDYKGKPSELTADARSAFDKKKTSTGTMYSRKLKESITQTIINHDNFSLQVTDNPTFKDFFDAVQTIVPATNEEVHKEIVAIATEAFKENYTDVLVQAEAKKMFESKIQEHVEAGAKLLDESYMVDSGESYVEYVVEQNGKVTQYVHVGKIEVK